MNLKIHIVVINLFQNRNLLLALLFAFCCFSSGSAYSQRTAQRISKSLQKGEIEKILELSAEEISGLEKEDDLRSIGEILLEDLQYAKSAHCYEQLLTKHKSSLLPADYVNYYFCLLNTGKQDLILQAGKQEVDSNQWVSMLKTAARAKSYYGAKENTVPVVLKSDISSENGFTVTQDTLRYFTIVEHVNEDVLLEETSMILNNKSSEKNLKAAVYQNFKIKEIAGNKLPLDLKSREFIGHQVFVLKQSKDVIYSIKSSTSGRLAIKIHCDKLTPFPFNSEKYDCAMPVFEENNQTLYYCSNKPGGFGSWDIYSCRYSKGKWLEPINLGDQVNTPFMEIFPSITANGLLFSSNGRIGAGGFDNYLFSFNDKLLRNLSPYNSLEDDYCLQEVQNTSIGIRNGTLVDYQSIVKNSLLDVKKEEGELIAYLYPERLEAARKEKIRQDSLLKVAQQAKLKQEKQAYERKLAQWNSHKDLYFEIEQTKIEESQMARIDSMIQSINDLDMKQVYVVGYADGFGTSAFNRLIAVKRALSLIDYLTSRVTDLKRVSFIPIIMGETLSLDEKSDQKTRKVDLKIVNESFSGKGLLAISNEYQTSQVSYQEFNSADLPASDKVSYVKVRAWHKVAPGETIGEISLKYNCPIESIKQMNNLLDNTIILNDYLFIPEENRTSLTKNNN